MKSLLNLRYLYKVHSKRIVEVGMNLTLDYSEAIRNQEVISLASSTTLRLLCTLYKYRRFNKLFMIYSPF